MGKKSYPFLLSFASFIWNNFDGFTSSLLRRLGTAFFSIFFLPSRLHRVKVQVEVIILTLTCSLFAPLNISAIRAENYNNKGTSCFVCFLNTLETQFKLEDKS